MNSSSFSILKKLIFLFFPKSELIVAGTASLFFIIDPALSYLALNILLFSFFLKCSVILHESGHLVFAKLAGGVPKRMILGTRHQILKKDVFGIRIVINSLLNSGLAISQFEESKSIKLRFSSFILGGPLTNLFAAVICYLSFGFELDALSGFIPASSFIAANLLMSGFALIPRNTSLNGIKHKSDGMQILKISDLDENVISDFRHLDKFFSAFDWLEEGEFQKAIDGFLKLIPVMRDSTVLNINLSVAYLKNGEFQKSLEILESLISIENEPKSKRYENFIYNNISWLYLILENLDLADKYSEIAYNSEPNNFTFQGTRGAILVEKEIYSRGIDLLKSNLDLKFASPQSISAAIYLFLAYSKTGKKKKAASCLNFLNNNYAKFDSGDQVLYKRVLKQTGTENSVIT